MTTETETPPQPYETATICQRCQTAQNWKGASWCPTCGYYPFADSDALQDDSWKKFVPESVVNPVEEDGDFLQSLPVWCRIMAGGIAAIPVFGLLIRILFPETHPRGLIALVVLAAGLVTILGSHACAVRQALREDKRIRLIDAFISWLCVWQPTFRELPKTCKRTWAFAWGVAAVVTATTVIGGINYSAPFQTELPLPERVRVVRGRRINWSQEAGKAFVQAATKGGTHEIYIDEIMGDDAVAAAGNNEMAMKQAVAAMAAQAGVSAAQMEDVKKQIEQMVTTSLEKEPIEAIIYGVVYTKGVATSFLFAGRIEGKYCHVAEIYGDEMSPASYRRITSRLKDQIQEHPAIPATRDDAKWVRPILLCRLRYTKMNDDHTLVAAEFHKVVKEIVKGNRSR